MISVYFQGKSFSVTVIQVYAPTTNAKEAEVQWFDEDLENLLVKVKALVMKLPLTLCDTKDCSPPGSSAHGILQARILEWVAIPFSKGSSWPRDETWFLPHCRKILYHLHHQESPKPSRTNTKKDVLIITGDWNAKVGSQELPRVIGKFGLGVQNEAGQRLTRVLPRERTGPSTHPYPENTG